ncbi:hypothetical protein B0H14DRAFT_3760513 [Mycena olivaceomarginata]|nr:hypothetical protein B0H14DRAFT_3760513 [Mycena olivaceomarginata]
MSFFRSKAERQLAELKKFSRTFHTLNDNEDYDGIISALTMIVDGWDTMSSGDQESAVKQYTALYHRLNQRRGSWLSAPLGKLLGRSNGRRGTTSASATSLPRQPCRPDCEWAADVVVTAVASSKFSQQLPRPHPPIMDPMNRINAPTAFRPPLPVDTCHEPRAVTREHAGEPGSSGVAAFSDCVTPPRRPDTSPSPGVGIASQHPGKPGSLDTRLASLWVWVRIRPHKSLDTLPCVGLPVATRPVEIIAIYVFV